MELAGGGSCDFISRQGNKVAHTLAKLAFSCDHDCFWLEDFPSSVAPFVVADMAHQ